MRNTHTHTYTHPHTPWRGDRPPTPTPPPCPCHPCWVVPAPSTGRRPTPQSTCTAWPLVAPAQVVGDEGEGEGGSVGEVEGGGRKGRGHATVSQGQYKHYRSHDTDTATQNDRYKTRAHLKQTSAHAYARGALLSHKHTEQRKRAMSCAWDLTRKYRSLKPRLASARALATRMRPGGTRQSTALRVIPRSRITRSLSMVACSLPTNSDRGLGIRV